MQPMVQTADPLTAQIFHENNIANCSGAISANSYSNDLRTKLSSVPERNFLILFSMSS